MLLLVCTQVFASHPQDFARLLPPLVRGRGVEAAEKQFLKGAGASGRNQLLYLYEMASFYRLAGEYGKSAALFAQADRVAREAEGKAVASVSGGFGLMGASLTNDTLLPWEGACFDKVMSRTLNALNFLDREDLEGAKVEVRKAEEYQIRERARPRPPAPASPVGMGTPAVAAKYGRMNAYVGNIRNSYENAFTYYLSSQIYRASGKDFLNDALVDIKRAHELAPGAPAIRTAYLELAAQLQGPEALDGLKAKLGAPQDFVPADPLSTGTLVVLFEAGLVPALAEVNVDLLLSDSLCSLAFPIYEQFGSPQPSLQISSPGLSARTATVLDTRPLAVKALQERMPGILARGALGALGKIEAQKAARKNFGDLGGLLAGVFTKVVTNADLRSWLSLPAEIQAAQLTLPAGPRELTLSAYDWTQKISVEVRAGGTTFLTVRGLPGFRAVHASNFLIDS